MTYIIDYLMNKYQLNYEFKNRFVNSIKRQVIQRLGIISDQKFFTNSHMFCSEREGVSINGLYSSPSSVSYFAPALGEVLTNQYNSRYFYSADNATIEPVTGMIYDIKGIFIAESSAWNPLRLFCSFPKPFSPKPNLKLNGEFIYLPSTGFFHWLIEDLAPFLAALEKYPNSKIIVPYSNARYVSDFLKSLNQEVLFIDRPTKVECLHFVGKSAGQGSPVLGATCHPKDIQTINNYFKVHSSLKKINSIPNRFYFSRRGASRSPSNELDLINELTKIGYLEFHQELGLDIFDQYSILAQAEEVIGIHGASLSHIAWMKSSSKVVEMHANYIPACYSLLSSIGNLNYHHHKYGNEFESKINIDKFINMLSDLKLN